MSQTTHTITETLANGVTYNGHALAHTNEFHGRGELTWPDQTKYSGDFDKNTLKGFAEIKFEDNDMQCFYDGHNINGIRHGEGQLIAQTELQYCRYIGQWENGLPHGKGVMEFIEDGSDFYEGDWKHGKYHGNGTMVYPNGDRYTGEWVDGKRHGHGQTWFFEECTIYDGAMKDDLAEGFGQLTTFPYTDDMTDEKLNRCQLAMYNFYVGQFDQGLRHGNGTYHYASGARYDGEWKDNRKHGMGQYIHENGATYMGRFENDQVAPPQLPPTEPTTPPPKSEHPLASAAPSEDEMKKNSDDKENRDAADSVSTDVHGFDGGEQPPSERRRSPIMVVRSGDSCATSSRTNLELSVLREQIDLVFHQPKRGFDLNIMDMAPAHPHEFKDEVERILLRHLLDLQELYRKITDLPRRFHSSVMSLGQFWVFLEAIGIQVSKEVNDTILFAYRRDHAQDKFLRFDPDFSLFIRHFVEGIVRIAGTRVKHRRTTERLAAIQTFFHDCIENQSELDLSIGLHRHAIKSLPEPLSELCSQHADAIYKMMSCASTSGWNLSVMSVGVLASALHDCGVLGAEDGLSIVQVRGIVDKFYSVISHVGSDEEKRSDQVGLLLIGSMTTPEMFCHHFPVLLCLSLHAVYEARVTKKDLVGDGDEDVDDAGESEQVPVQSLKEFVTDKIALVLQRPQEN